MVLPPSIRLDNIHTSLYPEIANQGGIYKIPSSAKLKYFCPATIK